MQSSGRDAVSVGIGAASPPRDSLDTGTRREHEATEYDICVAVTGRCGAIVCPIRARPL